MTTSRMRAISLCLFGALAAASMSQAWIEQYEAGLKGLKATKWMEARLAFKQAIADRPEDTQNPTLLPGPVTERRTWRNGAPYSPNFLAAYAGYKAAQNLSGEERTKLLIEVSEELEMITTKNQNSPEAYFFLLNTYSLLSDSEKRLRAEEKRSKAGNLTWKVDRDGMSPEDITAANQGVQNPTQGNNPNTPLNPPTTTTNPSSTTITATGRVAVVPTKYALIIGNGIGQIPDLVQEFGADDALAIREALIMHAGYDERNVDIIQNATRDQIINTAQALAERLPKDATVLIYYSGAGVNLDGKDFLVGVDASIPSDASAMVPKLELFDIFIKKEAKVFSFFQVARPRDKGRHFGSEYPMYGRIAQMQSTIEGGPVFSMPRNGKEMGIFTGAFIDVLATLRSNQIELQEFAWQVFYKMRGGSGGSRQTPTLPTLNQLSKDAPF
jgi:hypothetical protein